MPNDKQARLIAAENLQLQNELAECAVKVSEQKQLFEDCRDREKALLEEKQAYLQDKEAIEKKAYAQAEELMKLLTDHMQNERQKLLDENTTLKSRIEELEEELERLTKQLLSD